MKDWDKFVKEKLSEFEIQKGSQYEAKLFLAYEEMTHIFLNKEHRFKQQITQLKKENEKLRGALEEIYNFLNPDNEGVDMSDYKIVQIIRNALKEGAV